MLQTGYSHRNVVCPMPLETLIESASCSRATRTSISHLFNELSGGISFKSFTSILIERTLDLVRGTQRTCPYVFLTGEWADDDDAAQIATEKHYKNRIRMKHRQVSINYGGKYSDLSRIQVLRNIAIDRCGMFWRDLERYGNRPDCSVNAFEIPWLINGLRVMNLTVTEAVQLKEMIRYHDWESIPENYFDLLIGSAWEYEYVRNRRTAYDANDEIDRWRAAVALANADVLITDSAFSQLCINAGIANQSNTAIFSVRQINEITEWCQRECCS